MNHEQARSFLFAAALFAAAGSAQAASPETALKIPAETPAAAPATPAASPTAAKPLAAAEPAAKAASCICAREIEYDGTISKCGTMWRYYGGDWTTTDVHGNSSCTSKQVKIKECVEWRGC
ncbi:MAG: hypothetical protein AAB320_03130 [Elusimicrobiota bacterium]